MHLCALTYWLEEKSEGCLFAWTNTSFLWNDGEVLQRFYTTHIQHKGTACLQTVHMLHINFTIQVS